MMSTASMARLSYAGLKRITETAPAGTAERDLADGELAARDEYERRQALTRNRNTS